MTAKELLLAIHALRLFDKVPQMDDAAFSAYHGKLDTFIERFPTLEGQMKTSFRDKDYAGFASRLGLIRDMLAEIYAEDLAKECAKLISDTQEARHEKLEAYMTYFLTAVSMLSIDIQMALSKTDAKEQGPPPAPPREIPDDGHQKIILAVDDVSLFLNTLKTVLQNSPYKFIGVSSGSDALRFIDKKTPDLFILDIEMPYMNGYELAKRIRALGHTAPIIFLTANAAREYVIKAIQAGGVDFIVKPINNEQIMGKIEKYLN